MGNTTTKCILTGVSLETGMSYVINKTVSMSRDIRPPKPNETIFGATLDGTPLTREAVTELVRDTLIQCHKEVHLDLQKDLDFVVRIPVWLQRWNLPIRSGILLSHLPMAALWPVCPPGR